MHNPINIQYINEAEEQLQLQFPEKYKEKMQTENDGTLLSEDGYWKLVPIFDKTDRKTIAKTCNHIVTENKNITGLPVDALAIAHDEYKENWLLFKTISPGILDEKIYVWNKETQSQKLIATNIQELRPDVKLKNLGIVMFPKIDEVFENHQPNFKAIFFPLFSIQLENINQGKGKIHFVSMWGNGDPEMAFKDDWMSFDRVRFQRREDKYLFKGDLSFLPNYDKLLEWYSEAEAEYLQYKSDYLIQKKREEVSQSTLKQNEKKRSGMQRFYISSLLNYWITRDKYFETGKFIQGSAYTEDASNQVREIFEHIETVISEKNIKHIGTAIAYNYKEYAEDRILLFLNTEKQIVEQRFGW